MAVRGEELAVALSTTPNSTSANAWPARPFQALPRQIPGSIRLRAFRNVPSDVGVRADLTLPWPATKRAAVLLIEFDSTPRFSRTFDDRGIPDSPSVPSVAPIRCQTLRNATTIIKSAEEPTPLIGPRCL